LLGAGYVDHRVGCVQQSALVVVAVGTEGIHHNGCFGLDVGQKLLKDYVGVDKKFLIAFETASQNHTAHPRENYSFRRMIVEKWHKLEPAVAGLGPMTEAQHWVLVGGAPCLDPYDHEPVWLAAAAGFFVVVQQLEHKSGPVPVSRQEMPVGDLLEMLELHQDVP